MGAFVLGKVPLGAGEYRSGAKLPLNKLDRRLFGVRVNSPSDGSIQLYDANYGGKFPDGSAGLAGWPFRVAIPVNAGSLVPTGTGGYQMRVQVHYGSGLNQVVDGVIHVYLDGWCLWDFADVRFGTASGTLFDYDEISGTRVDGDVCDFMVEVNLNLNYAQTIYLYYGNQTATSAANKAATYVANGVIDNVVGAWQLDEADAEQAGATIIVPSDATGFWTASSWSSGGTIGDPILVIEGGKAKVVTTTGVNKLWALSHSFETPFNVSTKSVIRADVKGCNSGKSINIYLGAPYGSAASFRYSFIDNFTDERTLTIPFSSFMVYSGLPSWSSIDRIQFGSTDNNVMGTFWIGRVVADVGVPPLDSSGNGNDGVATGTSVIASTKYAAKNERVFVNGDKILLTSPVTFTGEFTAIFWAKRANTSAIHSVFGNADGNRKIGFNANANLFVRVISGGSSDTSVVGAAANVWQMVTVSRNADNKVDCYINNGSANRLFGDAAQVGDFAVDRLGDDAAYHGFVGSLSTLLLFDGVLSDVERLAIYANYPDTAIESGEEALVRVAVPAGGTEPYWGVAGVMDTRRAYGVQELYPSQDDLDFTVDWVNKKASITFTVGNTAEETAAAVEFDNAADPASFWTPYTSGTGSYDITVTNDATVTRKGNQPSLKMVIGAGSKSACGVMHNFSPFADWSSFDFVVFGFSGCDSGQTWRIRTFSNGNYVGKDYTFVDNWVGFKSWVIPKTQLVTSGVMNDITSIYLTVPIVSASATNYLNRCVVDVCSWAVLAHAIPDTLKSSTKNVYLYAYKPSISNFDTAFAGWDAVGYSSATSYASAQHYLDGTTALQIVGTQPNQAKVLSLFTKGRKGQAVTPRFGNVPPVTLRLVGTKWILPFAIGLPPADGQASATSGSGQCKLKMEIFFV